MSHKKIIVTTGAEYTITATDEERALLGIGMTGIDALIPGGIPAQPNPDWHTPMAAEPMYVAVPLYAEEEDDDDGWIYDIDIEEIICKDR